MVYYHTIKLAGIGGYIHLNPEGVPVKSTLSRSLTTQYAFLVTRFLAQVDKSSRFLLEGEEPVSYRLRINNNKEIIIIPDEGYIIVVMYVSPFLAPPERLRRKTNEIEDDIE
ncbi:uncharacterized protein LOC111698248 [Eurytemora carolleeae]|uniref:uncharacterized protein LOC111698248 n=1 Tax=Eurytemora carolleeae TaxID=1294199 RepID=UPI000C757E93|nr:uncharacterized protein LOC111698248 [Eurytemora carolleeae]|eukprot:XP_023324305.1 uncharacterized protein LOC111698248 [Eurytemora affinis]